METQYWAVFAVLNDFGAASCWPHVAEKRQISLCGRKGFERCASYILIDRFHWNTPDTDGPSLIHVEIRQHLLYFALETSLS